MASCGPHLDAVKTCNVCVGRAPRHAAAKAGCSFAAAPSGCGIFWAYGSMAARTRRCAVRPDRSDHSEGSWSFRARRHRGAPRRSRHKRPRSREWDARHLDCSDAALHARRVSRAELSSRAKSHAGRPGVARFRRVLELAEPATESPMESRLRMLLILGGLPRPEVQLSIHDGWGRFIGRPDLYYESHRLGIEYDGGLHRYSLAEDNRRQNRLLDAGVRLLRFTAGDVHNNPDSIVLQVSRMLMGAEATSPRTEFRARGAPAAGAPR